MQADTKEIKFTLGDLFRQIPTKELESIKRRIRNYSIVLFYQDKLIGSGTLIQCGQKYGILTAHHVLHRVNPKINLSANSSDHLTIVLDAIFSSFSIPIKYLFCHEVGIPISDEKGPDIIFLEILSKQNIASLKAKKSFTNLSIKNNDKLEFCSSDNLHGLWAISCAVEEQTTYETKRNYMGITARGDVAFTVIDNRYQNGSFDFVEVGIQYKKGTNPPRNFGGASGGGLWKINIQIEADKNQKYEIKFGEPIFAGMLFYQSAIRNNKRRIKCHGPGSIYDNLLNFLAIKSLTTDGDRPAL